jgi:hypothetical protein
MNKDQAISEFNLLMDQYVLIINKLTDLYENIDDNEEIRETLNSSSLWDNGITKDLYEHLLDALDFKIVEVK